MDKELLPKEIHVMFVMLPVLLATRLKMPLPVSNVPMTLHYMTPRTRFASNALMDQPPIQTDSPAPTALTLDVTSVTQRTPQNALSAD
jgi:hypothetical protein